ncbi:hypothetical protein BSL78_20264 [Apostichopus japonicus]|uniref:Uncharacterized protein n=1 Tax=Stichopus japonicus TaxID=307972 RepID=A0A2G8K4F1_STIJA|nr:hypothetical protein BSL78_20264 [Apostichopus japonicus]
MGGYPVRRRVTAHAYRSLLHRSILQYCRSAVTDQITKFFVKLSLCSASSLTISDGIYSVAVLIETHLYYRDVDSISNVYGAVVLASNLLSFFAIIGVGFDRYLALCGIPLKYKLVITTRRYGMIILAMVISSSLYSFVFTRFGTQTGPEVPIRMFIVLTICIATSSLTYVAIGASLLRTFNKTTLGAR